MRELRSNKVSNYRKDTLHRQMFWVESLLTYCSDRTLKQFYEPASTGRLYIKGLNLQNCPKRVRSVALGEHYIYDFKACAFSVFVSLFYRIAEMTECDGSIGTRALRDYITNRDRIRVKITRDLYFPTDTVSWQKTSTKEIKNSKEFRRIKTAFTAMGFGAKPRAGGYPSAVDNGYTKTALTKIFYSKEDTQNFLDHPLVHNIVKELQEVTKVILAYYKEFEPDIEVLTGFPYTGKGSRESILAHIYQGHEVNLLKLMIECAGSDALLPLHDGLATKKKLPDHKLINMKLKIKEFYPFVELDAPDYKGSFARDYDEIERIKEHKLFIRQQEDIARTYERNTQTQEGTDIKI